MNPNNEIQKNQTNDLPNTGLEPSAVLMLGDESDNQNSGKIIEAWSSEQVFDTAMARSRVEMATKVTDTLGTNTLTENLEKNKSLSFILNIIDKYVSTEHKAMCKLFFTKAPENVLNRIHSLIETLKSPDAIIRCQAIAGIAMLMTTETALGALPSEEGTEVVRHLFAALLQGGWLGYLLAPLITSAIGAWRGGKAPEYTENTGWQTTALQGASRVSTAMMAGGVVFGSEIITNWVSPNLANLSIPAVMAFLIADRKGLSRLLAIPAGAGAGFLSTILTGATGHDLVGALFLLASGGGYLGYKLLRNEETTTTTSTIDDEE